MAETVSFVFFMTSPLDQVYYEPDQVKFEDLCSVFFGRIDPTQKDGQGGDWGTQYRTGVYYHTQEQENAVSGRYSCVCFAGVPHGLNLFVVVFSARILACNHTVLAFEISTHFFLPALHVSHLLASSLLHTTNLRAWGPFFSEFSKIVRKIWKFGILPPREKRNPASTFQLWGHPIS